MEKVKSLYKKFLLQLFYLSLALGIIAVVYTLYVPDKLYSPAMPFLFPFFYGITAWIYHIILKASENTFPKFINTYMIITVLKLLLFVVIIAVYGLLDKANAIPFFIMFFIFYLVYTSFEVVYFIRTLKDRREDKKGK